MFNDRQLLGAIALTGAAGDAVAGRAVFGGNGPVGMTHFPALAGAAGVFVIHRKIFGDGDLLGTIGRAVIACGTGNGGVLPDDVGCLRQQGQLLFGEGFHLPQDRFPPAGAGAKSQIRACS